MIFISELIDDVKSKSKHLLYQNTLYCDEDLNESINLHLKRHCIQRLSNELVEHIIENVSDFTSFPLTREGKLNTHTLSLSAYVISSKQFDYIVEEIYHRIHSQAFQDGISKGVNQIDKNHLSINEVMELVKTLDPDLYDQVDIIKHIKQIVKDRKAEECIDENEPKYSKKDIKDAIEKSKAPSNPYHCDKMILTKRLNL